MGLFDVTDGALIPVEQTSFAAEHILERAHLQAALRDHISLLGKDLLVVSEEFGDFADANRRIDLLCVDRDARPVVVELKRTEDGGHMELQALRYAAMISAMTFEDLVSIYARHLRHADDAEDDDARNRLGQWLDDVGGEDAVVSRDVRIILVSAGFTKEITTTALWLNDVFGTDIRCVRLTPYRVEGRLLLDVQQVIPLPEAEELTVKLRRRETAVRASVGDGRDWTQYIVTTRPGQVTEPLRKRRAMLEMVKAVEAAGADMDAIVKVIGSSRLRSVAGELSDEELIAAFVAAHPKAEGNTGRWFFGDPLHHGGRTWVLSKMWGRNTEPALVSLAGLVPLAGVSFERAT